MSTPQTAQQMRTAAHQLAARIEHEMGDVAPHEKCEFRLLACELLRWADNIDPDRAPVVDDGTVVRFRPAQISERAWL